MATNLNSGPPPPIAHSIQPRSTSASGLASTSPGSTTGSHQQQPSTAPSHGNREEATGTSARNHAPSNSVQTIPSIIVLALTGLPFLELSLVNKADFGLLVNVIFATDRHSVDKGMVEIV